MREKTLVRVYKLNVGSCNGCDIEILATIHPSSNIQMVEKPEDANLLIVTGSVTLQTNTLLKDTYNNIRRDAKVIALGSCALSKGVFNGSYAITGPIDNIVPVDIYVPGCPPKPQMIMHAITKATGLLADIPVEVPEIFRGRPKIDKDKCTGCGVCARLCPSSAIQITDNKDVRKISIHYDKCIFCGYCKEVCPDNAILITEEYVPATNNRTEMVSTVNVQMLRCTVCGVPFSSILQINEGIKRSQEKVKEMENLKNELKNMAIICPTCRKSKIEHVKNAKKLFIKLRHEITNQ